MKSLFGGILLAVGILVAGLSGLCSLAFLVMGLSEPSGAADFLPMVLLIGGIPFLIGLGLFFAGRSLLRAARAEQQAGNPPAAGEPGES